MRMDGTWTDFGCSIWAFFTLVQAISHLRNLENLVLLKRRETNVIFMTEFSHVNPVVLHRETRPTFNALWFKTARESTKESYLKALVKTIVSDQRMYEIPPPMTQIRIQTYFGKYNLESENPSYKQSPQSSVLRKGGNIIYFMGPANSEAKAFKQTHPHTSPSFPNTLAELAFNKSFNNNSVRWTNIRWSFLKADSSIVVTSPNCRSHTVPTPRFSNSPASNKFHVDCPRFTVLIPDKYMIPVRNNATLMTRSRMQLKYNEWSLLKSVKRIYHEFNNINRTSRMLRYDISSRKNTTDDKSSHLCNIRQYYNS
ncbi:hypothetical protein CHS0354_003673 [Potamilus streckersoni]|uniref:Uncharacterized protein n=1 Tax=Potamilus streckersoni TaxID=2493646 RepID=A0AAE0W074_9BIVA|nr:hypothetical protein CHS0354_003673 [Potamilus streckersoni]